MTTTLLPHFIDGRRADAAPSNDVRTNLNPATGEPVSRASLDGVEAVDAAVRSAKAAFPSWSATPVGDRVQVLFRYKQILEARVDELADIIVAEHGKTRNEAIGSVRRGIDCIEHACAAPVLMMGRTLPQIAVSSSFCRTEDEGGVGIDSSVDRVPVGVCVGITPFNFPVMVPMWMWPMAIACGNTFVLKPSEKDPMAALRATECAMEAGLPAGVLNLVHGGPPVVNRLLEHPDVRAVSFVGSTTAGAHVYRTAAAHGKRVQCMCGAKNYSIIMPDANREAAIDGVLGSAFGNTGQRCLAGSAVVCVGDSAAWFVPGLLERAGGIDVGDGAASSTGMGPLQDHDARDRVVRYIQVGLDDGATLLLDGREAHVPSAGCFVGPTVFDHVRPEMRIASEEIFGPVLSILREPDLDHAIATTNLSRYGNMAVIFTDSGHAARRFERGVEAGMIGVNVGVPAPMA
ncbi:MAG: CoA-acylating methylmalonate-semialdehyde dehydrogenase, partial [Phycisphaerales bacterium]|nr:CoA-acylating methylmalonate-semialdehyde dehydrogenase [Phycisphaerales bacterium]